ncbi:MAG: hypothetical protein J6I49_07630 [Bacteroidales bacterium]|nr:hypothetical protein [Bacteroidales bacterium]
MKHTRTLLLALAATLLLPGCFQSKHSLVRVCHPTDRLLRQAGTKYADHTPLTADDLRHWMLDDTVHYKIAIVYSYCCGPCREAMRDTYVPLLRNLDTARCRMYFILDDCGSLPWNADYLAAYGIATRYYMRDADSLFHLFNKGKMLNLHDWTAIVNYALQPRRAFTDCGGKPLTLIVSPDGRVKQVYEQFADYSRLNAYDLRDMVHRDSLTVYQLDYDRIDTLRYSFAYDTVGMYAIHDTVGFRTYRPQRYCTPDGKCY